MALVKRREPMKDKILPIISILFCALMAALVLFQMQKISDQLADMQAYVSGMNSFLGVETEVSDDDQLVITGNQIKEDEIEIETKDMGSYLLFTYTNKSSEVLPSMSCDVVFYDEEGNMQGLVYDYIYNLFPGSSFVSVVSVPYDSTCLPITYNSIEIVKHLNSTLFTGSNRMSDVSFEYNVTSGGDVVIKATNNSTINEVDDVQFQVLFYQNENIIETETTDIYSLAPGANGYSSVTPYAEACGSNFDYAEVRMVYAVGDTYYGEYQ